MRWRRRRRSARRSVILRRRRCALDDTIDVPLDWHSRGPIVAALLTLHPR